MITCCGTLDKLLMFSSCNFFICETGVIVALLLVALDPNESMFMTCTPQCVARQELRVVLYPFPLCSCIFCFSCCCGLFLGSSYSPLLIMKLFLKDKPWLLKATVKIGIFHYSIPGCYWQVNPLNQLQYTHTKKKSSHTVILWNIKKEREIGKWNGGWRRAQFHWQGALHRSMGSFS